MLGIEQCEADAEQRVHFAEALCFKSINLPKTHHIHMRLTWDMHKYTNELELTLNILKNTVGNIMLFQKLRFHINYYTGNKM